MCTKKGGAERWVEDREPPPGFTMSCKNLIYPHRSCIYRNCIAANIGSFAFRDFWEIKIIFNTDDLVYKNFIPKRMANWGLTLCKNTVVQSVRHVFFHSFREQNQRQEPKLQHEKYLVKWKFEREREYMNVWAEFLCRFEKSPLQVSSEQCRITSLSQEYLPAYQYPSVPRLQFPKAWSFKPWYPDVWKGLE